MNPATTAASAPPPMSNAGRPPQGSSSAELERDFEAALEHAQPDESCDDSAAGCGPATHVSTLQLAAIEGSDHSGGEGFPAAAGGGTSCSGMSASMSVSSATPHSTPSVPVAAPLTAESLSRVLQRIETAGMGGVHAFEVVGGGGIRMVQVHGNAHLGWQLRLFGERARESALDVDRLVERLEGLGHRIASCEAVDARTRD